MSNELNKILKNQETPPKSFYEGKAREFVKRKQALEHPDAAAAPELPCKKKASVIDVLSTTLSKIFSIFKGKPSITPLGEVVTDTRELSKNLQVCEPLSSHLFGLILDDHAIAQTDFQGVYKLSTTIDYMGTILAKNKDRFATLGIDADAFIQKFAFPSAVVHDLETLFKGKEDLTTTQQEDVLKEIKRISTEVVESIKQLSPGERILLPGGWSSKTMGSHAILYEVIKDSNNSYRFAVYNTGDGIQYHTRLLHDLKEKQQGFFEIHGISSEKICSVNFYKTLFELIFFNIVKPKTEQETQGSTELYTGLLKSLGGSRSTFKPGHLGYRSPQRSGTCAWKCLMESLRQSCTSYEQYRRVKYLVQCQVLVDFDKTLQTLNFANLSLRESQSLDHLLKISSEKIGRSLTKSFDKGWISQKELEEGLHLIETLKSRYVPLNPSSGIIKDTSPANNASLAVAPLISRPTTETLLDQHHFGDIKGGMPNIPELNFHDDEQLEAQITHCYQIFKTDSGGSQALRGLDILSDQIMKLPMPKKGVEDIWDRLSESALNKKSEQLRQLIRLMSCLVKIGDAGCPPKILLSAHHLLAILDKLAKKSSSSKLPKAPVYAGLLKGFKGVGFLLPTKALQDYREAIESYFEASDESPENRLFSFSGRYKGNIIPFRMLIDFAKGAYEVPADLLNDKLYLDKAYLDDLLQDPTILKKLEEKGIYERKAQIQTLLEDVSEYLPPIDGCLKEATLLTRLMQKKLTPAFGNIYLDKKEYSDFDPEHQLSQLFPTTYKETYGTETITGITSGIFCVIPEVEDKTKYIDMITDGPSKDPDVKYYVNNQEKTKSIRSGYDGLSKKSLWLDQKTTKKAPPLVRALSGVEHQERALSYTTAYTKSTLIDKDYLPNEVILKNHRKHTFLSFEETLHTRLINVDKRDAPWRLISFLEEHLDAFQEKGIQRLLISYLYHSSTTTALQEQPLFVEKLLQQMLRVYEQSEQHKDIETAAFVMQYLKRLEGRYKEISGHTTLFLSIPYRANLLALRPFAKNETQKVAIDLALGLLPYQGACLQDPFTQEMAQDVLRATFVIQNHQPTAEEKLSERLYKQELRYIQTTYRTELAAFLNTQTPANRNNFLERLLGQSNAVRNWTGNYPDYTCEYEGKSYLYNVIRGELKINGTLIKQREALESETLQKYGFTENTPMALDGAYYSLDGNKRLWKDSNEIICEYKINNSWCSWTELEKEKKILLIDKLNLDITGYYKTSSNHSSLNQKTLFLLTDNQANPIYTVYTHESPKGFVIEKITKTANNRTYYLVDRDKSKEDLGFHTLEKSFGINNPLLLWQGEEKDDRLLEFNHGALSFRKNQEYYECTQYPGFLLATPKKEPLSGFMDYIHLIHKSSGQEKLVVFSSNKMDSSQEKNRGNFFPAPIVSHLSQTFNLDKHGMPIIKTSKDCLWLSYAALLARNYEKSMDYLLRAKELGPTDSISESMLSTITKIGDNHPDAMNCKMLAACLRKKNSLLYTQPEDKEETAASLFPVSIYSEYLTTYGKGALAPLPQYLETLLWTNLSEKALFNLSQAYPLLIKRYDELQGKNVPEVKPIQAQKNTYLFDQDILKSAFANSNDFIPVSKYFLLDPLVQEATKKDIILDKELLPFLGSGKSFSAHFLDFYQDAKNNSKELVERLKVMRGETNPTNRYLAWVLEQVMRNKKYYPPLPNFENANDFRYNLQTFLNQLKYRLPTPPLVNSPSSLLQIISLFFHRHVVEKNSFIRHIASLVKRIITWIKSPNLHKFIHDIKQETKNKSSTHAYRVLSAGSEDIMPLSLTKEVLFQVPITQIDLALIQSIQDKIKLAENSMKTWENEALALAEKLPKDPQIASLIQMKRMGHLEKTLTMQDLIGLFIIGQQKPYLDGTYLTQAEVAQLEMAIGQYLQQKILKEHALACLEAHKNYISAPEQDKEYLRNKLLNLVNEKPQYNPQDHREYLVFEALTGLRLRQNQIEKLNLLSAPDKVSTILHMIMGDGKSTVITPIIALLMARKNLLPFIVVPDSLHKTGKETTKLTVFESFGKHAHPFEIDRNSSFSKDKLQTLLASLAQWKKEKGFIYTTRESLLSFLLKSKELFYQYTETQGAKAKEDLKESIELAWSLLREIKENGGALLDEAHSLLNCRDELNFTFGQSNHIKRAEATVIYELLELLITDPQMKKWIDLQNNNQAKMSSETYTNKIKPALIKHVAAKFGIEEKYFYDRMDQIPASVLNHPDKNLIALSKVCISTFLPHTLSKKRDEHYGLGSSNQYCIPYIGNNTPNEKAEFASYIETLLYTGYYYSQQGLTTQQLRHLKQQCLTKCKQEQIVSKLLASQTNAYALFKKITGQDLSYVLDEEKAHTYTKEHPSSIFEYCLEFVLPEIKIFPSKLSANPHHLAALFKEVDGMTGTPWNKNAYPSAFKTAEEEAIDAKSSEIVRKIQPAELITLKATQDKLVLQELITAFKAKPSCKALIDAGALIKDTSNKQVAKALLSATKEEDIDGIAYYDEENELRILERATGHSVLFKDSLIPKERRVTFYDQRHTLGSDITQARNANALVTLSETIKKFELFQAIWRMREIDRDQSLTFVVPESIRHLISSDGQLTAPKVLDFVTKNQKEQELFDNFRSRKLEIKSIVDGAIHEALIYASTFSERLEIFERTQDLLMQPLDIAPFEAFGGIDKEEEASKILKSYTQKWLAVLDDLAKKKAIKDATPYKEKIDQLKDIPLSPTYRTSENSSMDTQIENQVEMQVKLTVATKPDTYQENIKPWTVWKWPETLNIFKDDWMRESTFFNSAPMPLYRASSILEKAKNPKVALVKAAFNKNFLVSNNFLPRKVKSLREIKAEPFAWYAKPVYHLVVMQEPTGLIKTLMIDQNDLAFFRDKILQDNGQEKRKICIYDPVIGMTLQGKNSFDEKELKTNGDFLQHLVYAKFWNGISKYTPEESVYLEKWISELGTEKMYDFFLEILRNKDDSVKDFNNSILASIFEKLLMP